MSTVDGENITPRLREELQRLGLSQAKAAANAGEKSPHRVKAVLSGRQKCPPDLMASFAAMGVDIMFVLTGDRSTRDTPPAASSIPLYDLEAAAGDGKDVLDESESRAFSIDEEILAPRGIKPEQCVMLSISGDSMLPTLSDGDVVVVDRTRDALDDGIFLFEMDGRLRVKRLQRVAGGAYVLISDNEKYQAVIVPPNELNTLRIIGRCVFKVGAIS